MWGKGSHRLQSKERFLGQELDSEFQTPVITGELSAMG